MMKQKNWFSFFTAFFFLFLIHIFSHGVVNAEQSSGVKGEQQSSGIKGEQGEEIYAPPVQEEEPLKQVEEEKIKLKDFTKKPPKKSYHDVKTNEKMKNPPVTAKKEDKKEPQEERPIGENAKDSHTKEEAKDSHAAKEDHTKEEAKDSHAAKEDHTKEISKAHEKTDKMEVEKPLQSEGNKLVEPDDKSLDDKKSNGIIWFFGVFISLLIVIFAFT